MAAQQTVAPIFLRWSLWSAFLSLPVSSSWGWINATCVYAKFSLSVRLRFADNAKYASDLHFGTVPPENEPIGQAGLTKRCAENSAFQICKNLKNAKIELRIFYSRPTICNNLKQMSEKCLHCSFFTDDRTVSWLHSARMSRCLRSRMRSMSGRWPRFVWVRARKNERDRACCSMLSAA